MRKFHYSFFEPKTSFFKPIARSPLRASTFTNRLSFFSTETSLPPLRLPVLDALVDTSLKINRTPPLKNTAIVCVTHAFPTVTPLLRSFVDLGAQRDKIFIMGKLYSECENVIQEIKKEGFYYQRSSRPTMLGGFHRSFMRDINKLLTKCMASIEPTDNVLILDHGGHALAFAPPDLLEGRKVVGIEKTTAGLLNPEVAGLPFPIIRMADCAAKKILESPLIAEEITQKLVPLIPIQERKLICGVVGYGAIGKAISDKLLTLGHKVMVYDRDREKMRHLGGAVRIPTLAGLVANSEYILDCTGEDISVTIDVLSITNGPKTLISCSSEDKAFRSLLQFVQSNHKGKMPVDVLGEITYENEMGFPIRILRGGFPINFDNLLEASPPNDIQLTRALVLGATIQATQFFTNPSRLGTAGSYMLDPHLQKFIVQEWLKYQPMGRYSEATMKEFQDEGWIASQSGGQHVACDGMTLPIKSSSF